MSYIKSPKVIICVTAVLIVMFFFLSTNRYSASYNDLKDTLSKTQQASLAINNAMLMVRGGITIDYDQLVTSGKEFEQLIVDLNYSQKLSIPQISKTQTASYLHLNLQESMILNVQDITDNVKQRISVAEQFKSNFSILRNSRLIIFQLLDELRGQEPLNEEFNKEINTIERYALHVIEFSDAHYRQQLRSKLRNFKSKYSNSSSPLIAELIIYIISHSETIFSAEAEVLSLVQHEILLTERFDDELGRLLAVLNKAYKEESKRALNFFYSLVIVAVFTLMFGASQARRSYQLTRQLSEHNENLESLVKRRTTHLEAATTKLEIEKRERDILLNELERSKIKLNALINNIHGCVYEYCVESGKMHYVSNRAKEIWGIEESELDNIQILRDFIDPDDHVKSTAVIIDAINNNINFNIEYRITLHNGTDKWLREIGTPTINEDESISVVGIIVDITSLKKSAAQKAKMEEELVQVQKLESIGQLSAGLAHEINTPAQFISDNLIFLQDSVQQIIELIHNIENEIKNTDELLLNKVGVLKSECEFDYLEEEVPLALKQSSDGISRIATIVRAMKDYSQSGQSFEFSDINSVLNNLIILSNTEWKNLVSIKTDFDESLPLVECVVGDINQVVLNILVNALHAVEERYKETDMCNGHIVIRTKARDECVYIDIQDNGIGMSESTSAKVFDQFFTTKEVGQGTGQGLSVAYRLIKDKHRGNIELNSQEGQGTTFSISLPIQHRLANH